MTNPQEPKSDAERAEASRQFTELMKQLPSRERRVLEMRYVEELTYQEIAETLNISPTRVRVIARNAMKRFRELYDTTTKEAPETAEPASTSTTLPTPKSYGLQQIPNELSIYIDPGDASAELLTEFYVALSSVYRAYGGSGLKLTKDQLRSLVGESQL